jgi:biotin operon repressor
MSRRAVLKQLERLKTWGAIKELRVKVGKHEAIFYEAK